MLRGRLQTNKHPMKRLKPYSLSLLTEIGSRGEHVSYVGPFVNLNLVPYQNNNSFIYRSVQPISLKQQYLSLWLFTCPPTKFAIFFKQSLVAIEMYLASGIAQVSFPRLTPWCPRHQEQVSQHIVQAYSLRRKIQWQAKRFHLYGNQANVLKVVDCFNEFSEDV